jgi:hypothetical protein
MIKRQHQIILSLIIRPFFFSCPGLREANDELQAQLFSRGLEEGRTLLSEHVACNSLAAEFEVMSQDDVSEKVNNNGQNIVDGILSIHISLNGFVKFIRFFY